MKEAPYKSLLFSYKHFIHYLANYALKNIIKNLKESFF